MAMRALIILMLVAALCNPPEISSCGPFLPEAVFTQWSRPEQASVGFARGRLGILQPAYARFYLVIAYRYLSGAGLNDAERIALFPAAEPANEIATVAPDAVQQWLTARSHVPDAGTAPKIAAFRQINVPNYFSEYLNCGPDAFRNAAATLAERAKSPGATHAELKTWVQAQDEVFMNCSGGPVIPATLESGDVAARADRMYQIAAAHFYAGQFEPAEASFRQIASDASSPWREIAPYLVARTLIREATLGIKGQGVDKEKLLAAEKQLHIILNDSSRTHLHGAASKLLEYVDARLRPADRMKELARALTKKDSQATIAQDLNDYRLLYNQFEGGQHGGLEALPVNDDLTDWLRTFQTHDPLAVDHALLKWHQMQTLPWLVASISGVDGKHVAAGELIAASGKVPPESPAFAAIEFHAIRLMIEARHDDEARSRLDQAFGAGTAFPPSATNLFRAEQMKIARNWDEFLKYAPRIPTGVNYGVGETDMPSEIEGLPKQIRPQEPAFDADSVQILNGQTPLELLKDAARGEVLPKNLRAEVAMAAWVRAVLVGDEDSAREIAPLLQRLMPELQQLLDGYLQAGDSGARRFTAVWLMLKFPDMRPYVVPGFGRLTQLGRMDHLGDNWWCASSPEPEKLSFGSNGHVLQLSEPLHALYSTGAPSAQFLSPAQKTKALEEWLELSKAPAAPDYLTTQTVEWARSHRDDPRVPEALHLAVQATRYGCASAETGRHSEEAFRLLHRTYPDSEWARKTRYWYGRH
ncbi:MAG: hypothetical protein JWO48_1595 [Bryobacterales bacterium]|nr:hypothetical protein [Bryobacterales bacterium]